jgi:hypothetical protein
VGLANLGSKSETCVGRRVHLVGVSISFEKNFYRLPFAPPLSGSPYRSFTYLLLYVDDIVLTASSQSFLQRIISALRQEFSMTDMGPLHHFLGISFERHGDGLFLLQCQYLLDILDRTGMPDCKPCSTPVETHSKLSADGMHVTDPTHYRSIAGALHYLTFTRPDITFAVQQVCLFMHDPREPHFTAMKRILRYL